MKSRWVCLTGMLMFASLAGCAQNAFLANNAFRTGAVYGEFGICGNGNNATVDRDSRLTKLSIIGDNNNVTVEEDATLAQIEFWGTGNTVSIPEYLDVRVTNVGKNNTLKKRPAPWRVTTEMITSTYSGSTLTTTTTTTTGTTESPAPTETSAGTLPNVTTYPPGQTPPKETPPASP